MDITVSESSAMGCSCCVVTPGQQVAMACHGHGHADELSARMRSEGYGT